MALKIFNTMTRRKEDFAPLVPGHVGIYSCGVTPYDLSHVGHARSAMGFDVIVRYLRFKGLHVRFVRNFTDVDDKIINRAAQEGVAPHEVARRYIDAFRRDMAALGVLPADVEPKATEHMPQMITLIAGLIAGGIAYVVDGDVYFEVRRFPSYGRLSGKKLDELLAGARVGVDERKRDPRDFALWKSAKPGEPSWPSPWGAGRPGWHIECSAMAMQYLGESFDIHGGGEDLIFPHHECEIAQAEAVTHRPFARYWMHNGMVNLGAQKMSKSLGNILTIESLVARHDPEAIRLYLLGTHYRSPLEYSEERIAEAGRALERLRAPVEEADRLAAKGPPAPGPDGGLIEAAAAARGRFEAAMDDDFNTAQAIGVLFDLARLLQTARGPMIEGRPAAGAFLVGVGELVTLARTLGLLVERPKRAPALPPETRARIEALIGQRDEARRARDFALADRLREELLGMGVLLEDTHEGTTWRART